MFDSTISLGNLLTIASFAAVIVTYVVIVRYDSKLVAQRLEMIEAQIEDFRVEMKEIRVVLSQVAVQKQELASHSEQITRLMGWYDELRRGEGFVFPMQYPKPQR